MLVVASASLVVANVGAVSAGVTTRTPVMGPSLLTAQQLATWYGQNHGSIQPRIPALHNNVAALAQIFIDEGKAEGVRGDIAFVQSMIETGWLGFAGSQIPPDAYNYAGINAFDGRASFPNCRTKDTAPSRCMGTPQHGVLMQIQLLRSYADPKTKTMLGSADLGAVGSRRRRTAVGVLRRHQLPVREAHLGVGSQLRPHHHPHVLTSARRRAGSPVRACRTARRTPAGHPARATGR